MEFHLLLADDLPFLFTQLMPFVLVVVGGSLTLGAVVALLQAVASYGWPSTPGRVIGTTVEESSGGGETEYTVRTPKLEYAYEVNGENYVGTRRTLSDRTLGSEAAAVTFVRNFPKDATVVVRYHPKDPAKSVLQPGIGVGHITGFFFPVLLLAGGIFLYLIVPKLNRFPVDFS